MALALALGWFLRSQVGGYGRAHRVVLAADYVAAAVRLVL